MSPGPTASSPGTAMWTLRVLKSPTIPVGAAYALKLGAHALAGRSPEMDIFLDDTFVSSKHALFEVTAAGLQMEDLRSTNGTQVNGSDTEGAGAAATGRSGRGRRHGVPGGGGVMRLRAGVASDCGLVRPANEDSFLLRPGLYAVCDGMGGARAGEVASQMACLGLVALDPASAGEEDLRRAIASTNKAITGRSTSEEQLLGMGTTITVALVKPESLIVAHVGDSRAYVLHAGELAQVTDDHSWVGEMVRRGEITPAQAAVHPHRSVITRALGTDGDVTPDTTEVPLAPGDRLLLCSDGLTGMVTDQVIAELLQQGDDPQETADALVMAALAGGGEDNVTVIVVHVEPDLDSAAGEDGGRAVDDRILFGPSDRGASVAPPSPRSRRAAATVRERLGRRVTPLARPVAAPPASAVVASAESCSRGAGHRRDGPGPDGGGGAVRGPGHGDRDSRGLGRRDACRALR